MGFSETTNELSEQERQEVPSRGNSIFFQPRPCGRKRHEAFWESEKECG